MYLSATTKQYLVAYSQYEFIQFGKNVHLINNSDHVALVPKAIVTTDFNLILQLHEYKNNTILFHCIIADLQNNILLIQLKFCNTQKLVNGTIRVHRNQPSQFFIDRLFVFCELSSCVFFCGG